MKRLISVALLLAVGLGIAFFAGQKPRSDVTLAHARAVPMGTGMPMFMVTLDAQNPGAATQLTGVRSPLEDVEVSIMAPKSEGRPLIIPGEGSAQLAMDGAHIMLRTPPGSFEEGALLPLALEFDGGAEVQVQVLHTPGGTGAMDHSATNGVTAEPAPQISLRPLSAPAADGFDLEVTFDNLTLVRVEDGTDHVPGEGHAHVYLNGLKLGRLYDTQYRLGPLLPGSYQVTVSVNTHDHRPYLSEGAPVSASFDFEIAE